MTYDLNWLLLLCLKISTTLNLQTNWFFRLFGAFSKFLRNTCTFVSLLKRFKGVHTLWQIAGKINITSFYTKTQKNWNLWLLNISPIKNVYEQLLEWFLQHNFSLRNIPQLMETLGRMAWRNTGHSLSYRFKLCLNFAETPYSQVQGSTLLKLNCVPP